MKHFSSGLPNELTKYRKMFAEYCCGDALVVEPADDSIAESCDSPRREEGCSNLDGDNAAGAVVGDKTLEALNF